MTWQKWVLVAFLAWGALSTVAYIGKPRKPVTPHVAVAVLVILAAEIALVVTS